MAELVIQHRGRRGSTERHETAIPVRGALVRRPRGPEGLPVANQNHLASSSRFTVLTDQEVMDFLESSGIVSLKELCSYVTPQHLLNQDRRIVRFIDAISDIINEMARTRRLILYKKLQKRSNPTDVSAMENQLKFWPVQVQQLQGEIEGLNGSYLRIPPFLVTDVEFLE